jgi:hypothetical protein
MRVKMGVTRGKKGVKVGVTMGVCIAASALVAGVWPARAVAQLPSERAPQQAAFAERIAVIPLDIVGDVPAGRPALEAAVLRGLTVTSTPTLRPGEAEARLRAVGVWLPCNNAECWSALGRTLDARYLVTGTVERKGPLFAVEFRLIDARPGRILATEANGCDADDCSVAELCRVTVRELARGTLAEGPDTPLPSGAQVLPRAAALDRLTRPAPNSEGVAGLAGLTDRGPADSITRQKWATAAIVAGTLAAGAGGVLVYYHYSCAVRFGAGEMRCMRFHDSDENRALIGGIAAAGAGVALLTTGVVLHLTGQSEQDGGLKGEARPRLSVGWGSIALDGRF